MSKANVILALESVAISVAPLIASESPRHLIAFLLDTANIIRTKIIMPTSKALISKNSFVGFTIFCVSAFLGRQR